jgi:hypothetical protein
MTAPSFATNKVDGGPEWHQVNCDGANQGDHANPKGRQDREAMTLYHSTPDRSVEVAEVFESPAEG